MRVAVCDDHLTFAEALQAVLGDRGHHVVGWSNNPYDSGKFSRAGVDVMLVDLGFPGLDTCEAIDAVRNDHPSTPIVVLTANADLNLIEQAFEHGADGAVLKIEGIDELESVLSKVHIAAKARRAARHDGPRVRSQQVQALKKQRRDKLGPDLTDREQEVLQRLTSGSTTRAIAESMGVEISTVRTHVQHLLSKFGAHSRLELVAFARRKGLGEF